MPSAANSTVRFSLLSASAEYLEAATEKDITPGIIAVIQSFGRMKGLRGWKFDEM